MAPVSTTPRRTVLVLAALLVLLGSGCTKEPGRPVPSASPGGSSSAPDPTPTPTAADPKARAEALVRTLTDEDLVGQVLMPYAYGDSATKVSAGSAAGNRALAGVDTPAEMVAKYRLGGLILVGFSADDPTSGNQETTNVDNPKQVRELTTGLRAAAGKLPTGAAPFLIGTDQEYGVVTRVTDGVTLLPSPLAAGAAGDPALTEAAWRVAGAELAAMGINMDFAPVADVLATRSTVIGSRSFGADPENAAAQVAGAVRGLQAAGVAASVKHFPGHGLTAADSHKDLPVVGQSRAELDRLAFPPFRAGIDAGAMAVMSAHLDVKAIDPGTPATFSHKLLTDVLRGQLGFQGVVITDGMNMAPAKRWSPGEAAVRALNAGNDLILMTPNVGQAYDGLRAALKDGSLPRARLVNAVTRVLTMKFTLAGRPVPDLSTLGGAEHQRAATALATAAVTMLRGTCGAPVRGPMTVTSSTGRDRTRAALTEALTAAGVKVVPSGGTVVHLVGYGDGAKDLRADAAVTVAMDTPYVLAGAKSPTLLATYSSSGASMTGLAAVLAGKTRPAGRSPVPVSGLPATTCGT
ncbi:MULTISPECIES: glycoside hydrolase family 3 protein [Micromonospora]|uniref:beta-N-acetylhexosaminidase n=1 Tax=Micromonospora solifontis TaxID=2487138 RepID=A0ABX9WD99_9ACTN|nr:MULTISPECIES: glycoside hydrolase family 3 N-terminal domain-containing protein [Micromonospora]NES13919.1 glycoside hydrolase family 3 [Micromonospora sp. PPF5-17B]NES38817.1 glycoside hydrolase family 3 [Micromonospora solifontis]NES54019.1 glycoside hydrolase family 3 [Micromonospora sp. PPF5-6]RNL93081.1 glycoside hydrolase family 3 [Micromonospora solifontis]